MAVTPATFVQNYPEFADALSQQSAMLQHVLDEAYALTPIGLWAGLQDQGAQLRAAQTLALSPFGRNLQLVSKDGSTVYDSRLDRLLSIVAAGGGVL